MNVGFPTSADKGVLQGEGKKTRASWLYKNNVQAVQHTQQADRERGLKIFFGEKRLIPN